MEMMLLKDCCDILDSMRVPITAKDRKKGPYPYYGANGVQDYVADYIFNDELVLLAEDGGNFGSEEKPIAYKVSGKCWVNNHAHVLKPKAGIDVDYLCYSLMFYKVDGMVNGATRMKLTQTAMQKMLIPSRKIKDQREIVGILNKVQVLIKEEKEQIERYDELIKSRFVEMFGDPVLNTMGWPVPFIEEVISSEQNALKAGPFGSALKKEFYVKSGYKIYGQEQVIKEDPAYGDYYIDEKKYKDLKNCAVKAGDVLISLVGTYGKLLIMPEIFEPGIINPRLLKITFDKTKVNPVYFKYYFQSDSLKYTLSKNAHGGTMDILNLRIVRKLPMPMPPIELQNQFAAFVRQVDKLKFEQQQQLEKTQILFDSLMQQYFG